MPVWDVGYHVMKAKVDPHPTAWQMDTYSLTPPTRAHQIFALSEDAYADA